MATQVLFQEQLTNLNQLVRGWDRRLRARQTSLWLPRALLPGLALGVVIAVISRLRPWLLPQPILLISLAMLVVGLVTMLALVWFWPRTSQQAAQRFDRTFGLKERTSTALELINGRIHSNQEIVSLQIGDAWEQARAVQPGAALPLVWNWREWAVAGLLAVILAVLLIIPNPQAEVLSRDAEKAAEIASAKEEIQKITQEISTDPVLKPEEREELLKALQTSSDILNQPDVTTEEAFATLSDAKTTVQNTADQMNQDLAAQQAALAQAQQALQNFQPQNGESGDSASQNSQMSSSEAIQNALQNQDLSKLSSAQAQALAQALEQAAQALSQTNPQAAQAMQQAADALRQGDTSTAQQQIQQAQQALQQDAQNAQNQQTTSQQLSENAQNIQQSAEQLSEQSNQTQQSQQQTGQESQQSQDGQPQSGQQNQQQGQQQQSQQSQQPSNGQPQPGQSQQGQQTDPNQQGQSNSGNQPGQSNQNAQSGQGQQPGQGQTQPGQSGNQPGQSSQSGDGNSQQGQSEPSQSIGGTGSGAGDNPGSPGSDQGGAQANNGSSSQNNSPDGTGEGQFEAIYVPRRVNGEGTEEIQLDPNASDNPVQEGNFAPNPNGDSSVPYNQVFSDYSNDANRALESDYIPLGLRDVVKNYFSSLEPGQGTGPGSTP